MDERGRVREALAQSLAAERWPPVDRALFLNRLLDRCGSDARPAASLLITHADATAHLLLMSQHDAWPSRRDHAALALTRLGLGVLDATWIVESWAYAKGEIGAHELQRARAMAAPPPPLPRPAAVRRSGKPVAPWRSGTPISAGPMWTRVDRLAGAVLILLFVTVSVAAWAGIGRARTDGRLAPAVPASELPPAPPPEQALVDAPLAGGRAAAITDGRAPQVVATAPNDPRFVPPLIARGVGGEYVVWRALISVTGDPACEDLEAAIDWRGATTETVVHTPGRVHFDFATRDAVRGRIGWDGSFAADPVVGETDGGSYRFTMRGRFTADGFEAETETVTRVLVKWRTTRTCRVLATLKGVRRPPVTP
jgi:hypothetical protein